MNMKLIQLSLSVATIFIVVFFHSSSSRANPFIQSVSPSLNYLGADHNANILIFFTQEMAVATLNGNNIHVHASEFGLKTSSLAYDSLNRRLIIDPIGTFRHGEIVTVILDTGIRTNLNVPIQRFQFRFTIKTHNGTGLFVHTSNIYDYGYGTALGDLDSDGDVDMLIRNTNENIIYRNNGSGDFTQYASIPGSNGFDVFDNMADMDNDGDLDILSQVTDSIRLYENDGNGNFSNAHTFHGQLGRIGDLDGNGYMDIAYFKGKLFVLYNESGILNRLDSSCEAFNGGKRLMLEDFNNDGLLDAIAMDYNVSGVFCSYYGNRTFTLYSNTLDNVFLCNNISTDRFIRGCEGNVYDEIYEYRTFDYDRNGYVDIIASRLKITNIGNGTFLKEQTNESLIYHFISGDFNGDNRYDILGQNPFLNVLIDNGSGHYLQNPNNIYTFASPSLSDIDNDGDLDAVKSYPVAVFLNRNSEDCSILGPEVVVKSDTLDFTVEDTGGRWEVQNFYGANAMIIGNTLSESVRIFSGNTLGQFRVVRYSDSNYVSCRKSVMIRDNPLIGHYTLGTGGDFTSFNSAVSALMVNGIAGNTTFNILPGTTSEYVVIDSIPGTNPEFVVTFRSQTGNPNDVIWTTDSSAINLRGYNNICFENIKFINNSLDASKFFIRATGKHDKFLVKSSIMQGSFLSAFGCELGMLEFAENHLSNPNLFENWPEYYIFVSNDGIQRNNSVRIVNNSFSSSKQVLLLEGQDSIVFTDNNVSDVFLGLSIIQCRSSLIFERNKISSIDGVGRPLVIASFSGSRGRFANNFAYGGNEGVVFARCPNLQIVNNTIYGGRFSISIIDSSYNIDLANNIIRERIELDVDNINYMNFNNITQVYGRYGANNGYWNLSEWILISGHDSNSVNRQVYLEPDGYHLSSLSIADDSLRGIPISGITHDIDGDLRNPLRPFMGADEPRLPFGPVLKLKLIPEGKYFPIFNMLSSQDSLKIFIRESEPPYSIVDSSFALIDSLTFETVVNFPGLEINGRYYIAVKHFNTIETWSKAGGELIYESDTTQYDFTTSASQAYGNNLKRKGAKYCLISGDVYQDGYIDGTDMMIIDNDAFIFVSGRFLSSDLNGDGFVDAGDMQIADNNVGRETIKP